MDDTGPPTFAELIATARGTGYERWRAIAALGKLPWVEAFDALVELAASGDWTVRRAATEALGQHALTPARAMTLLGAALHDPSSYVVNAACSAIAASKLTALHPAVLTLLRSPNAATRAAALGAVDALWNVESTRHVVDVHRADPDESVRRQAGFILYTHATSDWWPALVEMWRMDPLARHRVWACELAARSGSAELRHAVQGLLNDADGHVRKAALAVSAPSR